MNCVFYVNFVEVVIDVDLVVKLLWWNEFGEDFVVFNNLKLYRLSCETFRLLGRCPCVRMRHVSI